MALSIKNDDADRLARELAAETGESLTEAVVVALQERLDRERQRRGPGARARIERLVAVVAAMPTLDDRSAEAIIGYDGDGLPT